MVPAQAKDGGLYDLEQDMIKLCILDHYYYRYCPYTSTSRRIMTYVAITRSRLTQVSDKCAER